MKNRIRRDFWIIEQDLGTILGTPRGKINNCYSTDIHSFIHLW